MKKTSILTTAVLFLAIAAFARPTGSTTTTNSGPDAATTSVLLGAASAGLFGLRKFLKK